MKKHFPIWSILALVAVLLVSVSALAQEKAEHFTKVGLVNFTVKSVAVGVGKSWGEGHFIFQDKTYPIKIKGFSVVSAGVSSTNVVGDVYNLKDPSDIAGEYRVFNAGAAAGVGGARANAKNDKGVTIELMAQTKGVKIDLSVGSFTIELK